MSGSSALTRCIALPRLAMAISQGRGLTAMDHTRASEARLRPAFIEAEISARRATDALLTGLPMSCEDVRRPAQILVGYCIQCPDPFLALIIARVLRALLDDLDSDVDSHGSLEERAQTGLQLQSIASRIAGWLRDDGQPLIEQALMDIAVLHLRALEDNPRHTDVRREMRRIADGGVPIRPVARPQLLRPGSADLSVADETGRAGGVERAGT